MVPMLLQIRKNASYESFPTIKFPVGATANLYCKRAYIPEIRCSSKNILDCVQ